MNLPEPSGSSPPEKPPGTNTIWLFLILLAKASTDSFTSTKFLITKISTSAPALSKAFFVSYSQFVPGNTGTNTLGLANFVGDEIHSFALYLISGISPLSNATSLHLNTLSSLYS